MTDTPDFPALVELAHRLKGKDRKTCELALYTLKKQDERLAKKDERIAKLEELFKEIKLFNRLKDYPLIYGAIVMTCNEALGEKE